MSKSTRDNSENKEIATNNKAKSKLANNNRSNDIERGKFLLELYQKALLLSEKDLHDYFLDYAVSLTESTTGFFHFISEDQKSIMLTAWNGEALKNCVASYDTHYSIDLAGNWVDCVRFKRPVIYNDFAKSPNQKGFPSKHVQIKRFMSIPIFENGKVKIVFGVGNKIDPYTEEDVVQIQLIANELAKIYKQRQTEFSISESEKKYRSLFENMLDGFAFCRMIFDEKGNPVDFEYLEINNAFERLTGLKREAVVGKRVSEAIPGTEKANPELFEIYGRVALTCKQEKFQIFFKPLSKWFSIAAYCPQKGYFAAVFEDITERKQAEEALRESEQRWETTLASIGDAVIATDVNGNIVFMNGEAEELTGWTLSEASLKPVKTIFNILNEQTRFEVENPIDKVLKEGMVVGLANHTVLIRKDVSEIPIDDSGAPIKDKDGKTIGVVLVFRDVTERRKTEASLKEIKDQLELQVKRMPIGCIVWDKDFKVSSWNPAAETIFGYSAKDIIGKHPYGTIVPKEAQPRVEKVWQRLLEGDETANSINDNLTKQGKLITCSWSNTPLKREDNSVIGALSMVQDITERKEAEKKLEEYRTSLEKLVEERTKKLKLSSLYARNLIEASLNPLVTINVEGQITDVNKATELATGCSRRQLIGSGFSNYFIEPEKAEIGYKRVFTEGLVKDYPLAIRHRNGRVTDVLYNATVYKNEAGEIQGVFAAARDITELRKAEEEAHEAAKKLKDSERLAAIGATAGMVGHDIRNPLQAIIGDVFLAKAELASIPESDEKKGALESLEGIEKNIDYINKIVADLQDFARPLKPNAEEADLKIIIDELLEKNGLPERVKANVRVETEARKVVTDSAYIKRIVQNLVNNAVQAMPKGGKLTLIAYKEANDVVITVKDTGVGIPEAAKAKLFTPMFTTKARGQGFGLAVIKRMTDALGGTVSFESQEGKGTTFTVRLPAPQRAKR